MFAFNHGHVARLCLIQSLHLRKQISEVSQANGRRTSPVSKSWKRHYQLMFIAKGHVFFHALKLRRRVTLRNGRRKTMSTIPNVNPSTIDGIKRMAKSLCRENNLSHVAALDVVAQQFGYDNFHHARRALHRTQGVPLLRSIKAAH